MSLAYSNVKSLKPVRGIREAIIDITLDASYVNGGWVVAASDLLNYSGIASVIYNLVPPSNRAGYKYEWVPVSGNATGKLKASVGGYTESFQEAALAAFTMYPTNTSTEQAAAYCRVVDGGAASVPLSTCSSEAGYTANYQFFPDSPVALVDYVLFGAAVPFGAIAFDMSATVATYDAAGVVGWDYWNGTAWADLDASIINDGSGSTGVTGDYAWEQDGTMIIDPPADWAASTIDGQAAYWIKASIETGKVANMTQEPIATTEHDILIPDTGYVAGRNGVVSSLSISDNAATLHTANDIEFYLWNSTTGQSSGVVAFGQDVMYEQLALPRPVTVSIGDKLAIVVTQEDGSNEAGIVELALNYSLAEILADDDNISGNVVRCHVVGS
jgi:hypothetical protein